MLAMPPRAGCGSWRTRRSDRGRLEVIGAAGRPNRKQGLCKRDEGARPKPAGPLETSGRSIKDELWACGANGEKKEARPNAGQAPNACIAAHTCTSLARRAWKRSEAEQRGAAPNPPTGPCRLSAPLPRHRQSPFDNAGCCRLHEWCGSGHGARPPAPRRRRRRRWQPRSQPPASAGAQPARAAGQRGSSCGGRAPARGTGLQCCTRGCSGGGCGGAAGAAQRAAAPAALRDRCQRRAAPGPAARGWVWPGAAVWLGGGAAGACGAGMLPCPALQWRIDQWLATGRPPTNHPTFAPVPAPARAGWNSWQWRGHNVNWLAAGDSGPVVLQIHGK